jgi:phosphatidylglycerol:prolipoprotein diacylglycerol transferase
MVATGFLMGLWTASRRAMRSGMAPERVVDLGPWLIGGAIVGARIFYVVTYWGESFAGGPWTEIFMIQRGGLVFYGGLIGAIVTGFCYTRWHRLPFWAASDIMAPGIALGHMFGRLGCFLNGCCYGRPSSMPWAICYPADHETHGMPVHPTQLYEAAFNLALAVGLDRFFYRKRFDGQIFAAYMICYGLLRMIVEFFRGDYSEANRIFGLTPGQGVSMIIFILGVACWIWRMGQTQGASAATPLKP